MKNILAIICLIFLSACASQKKFNDFDISYTKSGGLSPIYENLLIKNNKVHYSLEGQGKKINKDFIISTEDKNQINELLSENKFKSIQEDYKKQYDFISISINVKSGENFGSKTNASGIMPKDQKKWQNIVDYFQKYINTSTDNLNTK